MLPDIIIIGAMKAGTTSLFRYLATNPEVVGSTLKEPNFFVSDEHFAKGLPWYEALFEGDGPHAMEASTNYSKRHRYPGVPERMSGVVPDAKLIYVLRDPVERVLSHYVHNYANGRENRTFADAIRDDQHSGYVDTSRYHYQIEGFLDHYPRDQILLVESEELRTGTRAVVERVARFAGIETGFDDAALAQRFHESSGVQRRSRFEQRFDGYMNTRWTRRGFRKLMEPFRTSFDRPVLADEDRARLVERLAPDVEELRAFSGMEFASWSL